MSDKLEALDYYALLGVADDAPDAELKRAFRAFARRFHPDRHPDASPERLERALHIYRRGAEAYRVLSEPESRRAYDAALALGHLRLNEDARAALRPPPAAPATKQSPIQGVQATALFQEAVRHAERGDWLEALRCLRAADRAEPGNPFIEARLHKVEGNVRRARG